MPPRWSIWDKKVGFLKQVFRHLPGQQHGIVTSCDGSCSGRAGRVDRVDFGLISPTILGFCLLPELNDHQKFGWTLPKCSLARANVLFWQTDFFRSSLSLGASGNVANVSLVWWHTININYKVQFTTFECAFFWYPQRTTSRKPKADQQNLRKSASQLMAASWASKPWKELVELVSATHQQVQDRLWRGRPTLMLRVDTTGWWFQKF